MKNIHTISSRKDITLSTIVYIPMLSGYWSSSLDILQVMIKSILRNTKKEYEFFVVDNGSHEQVCNYLIDLQKRKIIDILVLNNKNIGKVGGWNLIFGSTTSKYIAYSDSDVFFMKSWLEESIKIMDNFPRAGIVTAQPIAGYDLTKSKTALMAKYEKNIIYEEGIFIPDEYIMSCVKGLGRNEDEFKERQRMRKDVRLTSNGVRAYATASHFQFLTKREVVRNLFPDEEKEPLGKDLQFEDKMLDMGYWKLSTEKYLVHHMGNRMPNLRNEIPWINDDELPENMPEEYQIKKSRGKIHNPLMRKLLQNTSAKIFSLLYE